MIKLINPVNAQSISLLKKEAGRKVDFVFSLRRIFLLFTFA
jgi:hypothetical protein